MRFIFFAALVLLVGGALAAALAPDAPRGAGATEWVANARQREAGPGFVGANGCAATACHGSVRPNPAAAQLEGTQIRRDEFSLWADKDPHGRSLTTLTGERSQAMLRRLRIIEPAAQPKQWQFVKGQEAAYQNCLLCHSLDAAAAPITDPLNLTALEAVSCESCHGPAEKWRQAHYERDWTRGIGAKLGFVDTAEPGQLAGKCVKCHVGAADRQVSHDLIAAGHPALKFELAAYRELLPKHWNDARLRKTHTEYELTLWKAGQQQAALAALDVLAARVRPEAAAKWPEFAEYDCFACHHALLGEEAPRRRGKKPGELAEWNPWYFSRPVKEVAELRQRMEGSLLRWDDGLPALVAAALMKGREGTEAGFDPELAAGQWDRATQAYLELSARDQAYRDEAGKRGAALTPQDEAIRQQLKELRTLLAFEPGYQSPARGKGDAEGTAEKQAKLARTLAELQDKINRRKGG